MSNTVAAYWGAFRYRTIPVTVLSCLVIAGAPFFMGFIPLPGFLSFPVMIGLAAYLTMQYTGVELIPDGLFIPLGIEVVFKGVYWVVFSSGLLSG